MSAIAPTWCSGSKQTFVMMYLLSRDGSAKIVEECSYPLTGLACVSRVYTDLAVFGKAMANGFSVSALAGRAEILDQGGIYQTDRDRVFLLSAIGGEERLQLLLRLLHRFTQLSLGCLAVCQFRLEIFAPLINVVAV